MHPQRVPTCAEDFNGTIANLQQAHIQGATT